MFEKLSSNVSGQDKMCAGHFIIHRPQCGQIFSILYATFFDTCKETGTLFWWGISQLSSSNTVFWLFKHLSFNGVAAEVLAPKISVRHSWKLKRFFFLCVMLLNWSFKYIPVQQGIATYSLYPYLWSEIEISQWILQRQTNHNHFLQTHCDIDTQTESSHPSLPNTSDMTISEIIKKKQKY